MTVSSIKENEYRRLDICFQFSFEIGQKEALICRMAVRTHDKNLKEEILDKATSDIESYFKNLMLNIFEKGYDIKKEDINRIYEIGLISYREYKDLNEELIRHFIINNVQFYETNKRKIEFR